MNKQKSSAKLSLTVQSRDLTGKKAKKLRKQGLVLGNIFGPEFKSKAVSVNLKDFLKIYKTAKETSVVYLYLDKNEIPVLIKNVQTHPVTDAILHTDFRKIDLKKKIQTEVPIKVVGTSEAVTQKGGVLLIQSETLLVEAFPQDIPQEIDIDISNIKEIGQEIKAADLKKSDQYEIKTPVEKVIVSVIAHKEESITPDTTAAVAPEVITEAEKVGEEAPTGEIKETAYPQSKGKPTEAKIETPAPKK